MQPQKYLRFWLLVNAGLFALAIFSLQSDVWEFYWALFIASSIANYMKMK